MPAFGPVKRLDLIKYLRQLGFEGPFVGGRHEYMVKNGLRVTVPNPHVQDIGKSLLARILRRADISRDQWEKL